MDNWTVEQVLTEALKLLDDGARWVKETMYASIYQPFTGVSRQGYCAMGAVNAVMELHSIPCICYSDPVRQARDILNEVAIEMGYSGAINLNDKNPHGFGEVRVMFEKAIARASA